MIREKIRGIYKITSPSGRIYIGQSVNINARFGVYKRERKVKQPKLYHSFEKYGKDAYKFEIIVQGDFNYYLLDELEKHYIQLYNSLNVGLNCTSGGHGSRNYKITEESRRKRSLSFKGRVLSEETKRKLSMTHTGKRGRKCSEETKEKMRIAGKGRTHSKESKLKMRNTKLGKKLQRKLKEKCENTVKLLIMLVKKPYVQKQIKFGFRERVVGKNYIKMNLDIVILKVC